MEPRELPESVTAKVQKWLGAHRVLHFWERDETYFIVAVALNVKSDSLCCLRVFPVGGEFLLSQDNIIDFPAKDSK